MSYLSSLVIQVLKHLPGKHNQEDHAGKKSAEEQPVVGGSVVDIPSVTSKQIRQQLGLSNRTPLGHIGELAEGRMSRTEYEAGTAASVIEQRNERKATLQDVRDLAENMNLSVNTVKHDMSVNGWTVEEADKHYRNIRKATTLIRTTVEAGLEPAVKKGRITPRDKTILTLYFGLAGNKRHTLSEISNAIAGNTFESKTGSNAEKLEPEPLRPVQSIATIVVRSLKKMGIDYGKIAEDHGVTQKEIVYHMTYNVRESKPKGKK